MIYKFHFQGNHSEKVVDLDLQHITSSIILLYIQIQLKYMMLICFAFNLKWIYLCTSVVTLNRSSQHYSGVSVSPVCLNRQSLEGTQLVCSKYYFLSQLILLLHHINTLSLTQQLRARMYIQPIPLKTNLSKHYQ